MGRYKNITLTEKQQQFVRENVGKISSYKIAKQLSVSQNKMYENIVLMGLVNKRVEKKILPINTNIFEWNTCVITGFTLT